MCDHGVGHALVAHQRGERARVDAGKADDAAALQPLLEMQLGAIIRGPRHRGEHDEPDRVGRGRGDDRLDVLLVGADIPDMRKGEGDDLPIVGRVGQDLLIAGHGGVEADLADRLARRAKPFAFEHRAVGQHENRRRGPLGPAYRLVVHVTPTVQDRSGGKTRPAPDLYRICRGKCHRVRPVALALYGQRRQA